ncbi:hypothetical protein C2R22_07280 [Salinigranum rubrum]|uniref:Molybdopterin cofactor biosynthesis MoaD-related C-terminal domain-containing protein n=1 Tax=Salinigranum rubrum TaxID=755307 RepID=A0A2I8VPR6_9EURY|nr:hypothetical protein [Salinigranum rubrum]AUV83917.1 hypothetical protein C2R22_07280 [Salinigranum rubrum]
MTHADSGPAGGEDRRDAALDAIPPIERVVSDGRLRITRRFHGLTLEQAVRYLEHLGGERRDERTVEGAGWRARLTTSKAAVGPSYRLTEVTVTWTGEEAVVDPLVRRFQRKAFRAPG